MIQKRIAVYPISANPPTWGHADILKRAATHFDLIYWAAAVNPQKNYLFGPALREQMMKEYVRYLNLNNVTVESYQGGTVRYARQKKAQVIVKGIRNMADVPTELEQASANYLIHDKEKNESAIDTFFLFSQPAYSAISSSLTRELASLGEDIRPYVLDSVANIITECISGKKH